MTLAIEVDGHKPFHKIRHVETGRVLKQGLMEGEACAVAAAIEGRVEKLGKLMREGWSLSTAADSAVLADDIHRARAQYWIDYRSEI